MNKKNNDIFKNIWFIRIVSLFVSILLFSYVYSENYGLTTTNRNDSISTLRSETISNLPIEVNMNTDQYFISGLPETVMLNLSGPESVIVQTLSANDFKITTEDLDLLGPGNHTIKLQVENLSDELTYQITPSRINVQIEEKVSFESAVEVFFDSSAVADDYVAKEPILSREKVVVSGPSSTIERIDRIYVRVPADETITKTINEKTVVQVEDSNRNKLNVVVEPQEINVEIPVEPYKKEIPIRLTQVGTPVAGLTYQMSVVGNDEITATGNKKLLAEVDEVLLEVDVSKVNSSKIITKKIKPLDIEGATIAPEQVEIEITVEKEKPE